MRLHGFTGAFHTQASLSALLQSSDILKKTSRHLSSEIAARHQGRMSVESRKGEGSTFSVALPYLHTRGQA